nr:CDP-diglyceride synthetase [Mucilaginibacter sp. E4BP6]
MKITSNIFTLLLAVPVLLLGYLEYIQINNSQISGELNFILEMEMLDKIVGCCLLLGYSVFLTYRKKYLENFVFFGCFILFMVVYTFLALYTQKKRANIRHMLLRSNNHQTY